MVTLGYCLKNVNYFDLQKILHFFQKKFYRTQIKFLKIFNKNNNPFVNISWSLTWNLKDFIEIV